MRKLQEAWGAWLSKFDWDAWCTLTFRPRSPSWYRQMERLVDPECPEQYKVGFGPEGATAAFARFVGWLGAENPDLGWFYAHEVGRRGRSHLHALIGGLEPWTRRSVLWEWWHRRYGRAQILPFDPQRGAIYYVSKYMAKGELDYYDIRPPGKNRLSMLRPLVSVRPRVRRSREGERG